MSGRPKIYDKPANERLPGKINITRDNMGRVKFFKVIMKTMNQDEVITLALDALQEKISCKTQNPQNPALIGTNMPPYTFPSSNKQGEKNKILQPASIDHIK